jgi:hypothetical protein
MITFLGLVLILVVVVYFVNRDMMEESIPLLKATKKVEEPVVITETEVTAPEVVEAKTPVKKVVKKGTKKIVGTKKKTK